ncbi:MAG: hypothetical protein SFV81_25080 [Pirellulaceae bacterium]|nr:hypothetical protein [Pirellulaceae bacterium]
MLRRKNSQTRFNRPLRAEFLERREVMTASLVGSVLTIQGSAADDQIEMFGRGAGIVEISGVPGVANATRFAGVSEVRVNGLAGNDNIKSDNVAANLFLNGGIGNDQFDVLRQSTGVFAVQVIGDAGDDAAQVKLESPTGASSTANVTIDLGLGNDRAQLDIVSEAGVNSLNAVIRGGDGNDELQVQSDYKPTATSATTSVRFEAGAGDDLMRHSMQSDAGTSRSTLTTIDPSGMSNLNHRVQLSQLVQTGTAIWNVSGSSQMDIVEVEINSQASQRLTLNATVRSEDSGDVVMMKANHLTAAPVDLTLIGDAGAGDDEFMFALNTINSAVTVNTSSVLGGTGNDKVMLELAGNVTANRLVMDGGQGDDLLTLIAKGTLRAGANNPVIRGGDGNDKIESIVESLTSGSLLLDGGAGFDEVFGTGTKINAEIT